MSIRLPVMLGKIRRRLLVNFRADPAVVQKLLPAPFRPKLQGDVALVGICLIRLEEMRPKGLPGWMGLASENAAHRLAVTWQDAAGIAQEGVYIPRRDTGSTLNHLAGGRLFPGEHHRADFQIEDDGTAVELRMMSRDGAVEVHVRGAAAEHLPSSSCFASAAEASKFFEAGSVGFSVTRDPGRLDSLELRSSIWKAEPLEMVTAESSFFASLPAGSVAFDHALIMRDIAHEWHQAADFPLAES